MQAGKASVGKRLGRGGENELGETLDSLASKEDSLRNIGQKLELFRFLNLFICIVSIQNVQQKNYQI